MVKKKNKQKNTLGYFMSLKNSPGEKCITF